MSTFVTHPPWVRYDSSIECSQVDPQTPGNVKIGLNVLGEIFLMLCSHFDGYRLTKEYIADCLDDHLITKQPCGLLFIVGPEFVFAIAQCQVVPL